MELDAPAPAPPSDSPDQAGPRAGFFASWPPPSLERIHGDVWHVVGQVAPGGALLTFPLLLSASVEQDFSSLGVFGDAWWIVLVTSLVGSLLLVRGLVDLFRMFRRWASAVRRGYSHRTVATVLTDRARDAGFLMQGGHAYSVLPAGRRRAILTARTAVGALALLASLWLSAGFVLGALLASRGVLDESGLAWWTLAPLLAALVLAILLQTWESGVVRGARRAWYAQGGSSQADSGSISEWHQTLSEQPDAVPVASGGSGPTLPRVAAGVALLVCVAVPLIGLILMALAGVGPILAETAVPSFETTQTRAATVQAVEGYRLPTDASITALEAGEALVSLAGVGGQPPSDLFRPAARSYEAPIFPGETAAEEGGPTGTYPGEWPAGLVPRLAEGLDQETIAFLEDRGSHPALAEIGVLARAGALDEPSALWVSPLPDDLVLWELPIPRYRTVREAAYAHIGGAVADAARGRTDEAEMRLREVLSMGLLMAEDGSTLITNLIGLVIARNGADALIELYEATGRTDDALALEGRILAAERAAEIALVGTEWSTATALEAMPEVVLDDRAVRGRRWESFMLLNTLGPCVNLNRALFGADEAYDQWVAEARSELVRSGTEEALFEAARSGYFGRGDRPTAVERALIAVLGSGERGPNPCAIAVGQMMN